MMRIVLGLLLVLLTLLAPLARAESQAWAELNPATKSVLAPLAEHWEMMPEHAQARWIKVAEAYPRMQPEQQARVRERMAQWSRLSPEEQEKVRANYRRMQSMTPEEQKKLREKLREEMGMHRPRDGSGPRGMGRHGRVE